MNNIAEFVAEYKSYQAITSVPHILKDGKFLFSKEDCSNIRTMFRFFVSMKYGDKLLDTIRDTLKVGNCNEIDIDYFTSINDIKQFISICNILGINIELYQNNDGAQHAFIISKGDEK